MRLLIGLLLLLSYHQLVAQNISWEWLAPAPEPITNQGVAAAEVDGNWYVYSFAGLDSTISCSGDHLRVFRYDVGADSWETLDPIPDPLGGKIAPATNTVKGKLYTIGGYHLAPNCSETSSAQTHIFDPVTNTFLANGANIPVAIDDQVQAVWRDSLIFVVTGWSNTGNVTNVQIYNPSTDTWQAGTPIPTPSTWRVFGGSGSIIGDTLYYLGGARSVGSFGPTAHFRKGYINPADPTDISWEGYNEPLAQGYRTGATTFEGKAIWFGGSDNTYNFDGLAYNGAGVVPPLDRITVYDPATGQLEQLFGLIPPVMDLRGVAELGNGQYILVGGMLDNQQVTDQVLKITINSLTNTTVVTETLPQAQIVPNPGRGAQQWVHFSAPTRELLSARLVDDQGRLLSSFSIPVDTQKQAINVSLVPGTYWLQLQHSNGQQGRSLGLVITK